MYITMCLYITITILLWVLSIYPFIKHYAIVVSNITIQFSHIIIVYLIITVYKVDISHVIFPHT